MCVQAGCMPAGAPRVCLRQRWMAGGTGEPSQWPVILLSDRGHFLRPGRFGGRDEDVWGAGAHPIWHRGRARWPRSPPGPGSSAALSYEDVTISALTAGFHDNPPRRRAPRGRAATKFWVEALPRIGRSHLFSMDLSGSESRLPAAPEGYELVFPWTGDGRAWTGSRRVCGIPWRSLCARMRRGERLGLAMQASEPVHRALVKTRGPVAMETGRWAFSLAEGEAYIHYCETEPGHRGRGLYPAMLRLIAARLAQMGIRRAYIACATNNEASVRGIVKAGFRYAYSERALVMLWGRIRLGAKRYEAAELAGKGC